MLVAVLMLFTIFSFTGVAVLNISYLSNNTSMETVNNIKLQYALESSINESLWRINSGVDSLVNVTVDGITTAWDSSSNVLSVNVDMFQMESEVLLDLSEDTHFDRGIAAEEEVDLNGYTTGLEDDQQIRENFSFLPDVDEQFYRDNAIEIHTQSGSWWSRYSFSNDTLADGIHVFEGNYLNIDNITINSGTLVFLGRHINFLHGNKFTAPPSDSTGAYPALVLTDRREDFHMWSPDNDERILGAIFCKGDVDLENGEVSGPVVGRNVRLHRHFNFLDSENEHYFRWTKGFGHKHNYDWPKQIGRWKTMKWNKKHNA